MNRDERKRMAEQTLAIIEAGRYQSRTGSMVEIRTELKRCVEGTRIILPDDWAGIRKEAALVPARPAPAAIEVTGETTLAAGQRLIEKERFDHVLLLNFASARNPGGGFLGGSQAQEESLARSSGLYASLQTASLYYEANRRHNSLLYTDHAIYSPDVPVFRDDDGRVLDRPYAASFVTMPAANAGAMPAGSGDLAKVEETMGRRIDAVCALAVKEGFRSAVFGAWGCGVFRNDPRAIARLFHERLLGEPRWAWRMERIVFAVLDRPPFQIQSAFRQVFR